MGALLTSREPGVLASKGTGEIVSKEWYADVRRGNSRLAGRREGVLGV
jgi:hypothetical protein